MANITTEYRFSVRDIHFLGPDLLKICTADSLTDKQEREKLQHTLLFVGPARCSQVVEFHVVSNTMISISRVACGVVKFQNKEGTADLALDLGSKILFSLR